MRALDRVVVDVRADLEQVVDRPRDGLLVAGDRARADDDGVARLDLDEAVIAAGPGFDGPASSRAPAERISPLATDVVGIEDVLHKVKEVFASLYNDRAIAYRVHHGFKHEDVSTLSREDERARLERTGRVPPG